MKECMNTLMMWPRMAQDVLVSWLLFKQWSVLELSNVLFLCLDLNGFKEVTYEEESEEETGVVVTVFSGTCVV